jgi:hypothetical protein
MLSCRAGEWDSEHAPTLSSCDAEKQKFVSDKDPSQEVAQDKEIIFTYDMVYKVMGG